MEKNEKFIIYTWEEGYMVDDIEYQDDQFNKYFYHDYGNALQDFENKRVDEQDSGEYPLCIVERKLADAWYVVHHVEVSRLIERTGLTAVRVLEGKDPFREDIHIYQEKPEHTQTEIRKAWQEGRKSQADLDGNRRKQERLERETVHNVIKFLLDNQDRVRGINQETNNHTEDVHEIGNAQKHSIPRGQVVTFTITMGE